MGIFTVTREPVSREGQILVFELILYVIHISQISGLTFRQNDKFNDSTELGIIYYWSL